MNNTILMGITLGTILVVASLVVASLALYVPQAWATADHILKCPDGSEGPPCGPPSDRVFKCPDGSEGPPCGPPDRLSPEK